MSTHFSILAWKIPWIEESSGLQSMWSQRVIGHNRSNQAHPHIYLKSGELFKKKNTMSHYNMINLKNIVSERNQMQ